MLERRVALTIGVAPDEARNTAGVIDGSLT